MSFFISCLIRLSLDLAQEILKSLNGSFVLLKVEMTAT